MKKMTFGLGGSLLKKPTEKQLAKVRGERFQQKGILYNYIRDVDEADYPADATEAIVIKRPIIDMAAYGELLALLPDKIVNSLEGARLERAGIGPMLRAGGGTYEELLSGIIVDATAVASSSAEAKLAPALLFPANFMAPGGIPGKAIKIRARGRGSTIVTTAGTMIVRHRIAATDVITGNTLMASGGPAADGTAQTNTQWVWDADVICRSVGSAGTVFGMGNHDAAWFALTIAAQTAKFAGSAGSAAPSTAVWDTTVPQFFQFTAQWSLATAYSIQSHQYLVEALN